MNLIIYFSLFLLFALAIGFVSFLVGLIFTVGDNNSYVDSLWGFAWFAMVIVAAIELVIILYLKGMIPVCN